MKARNISSLVVLAIALPSLLAGCPKTPPMASTAASASQRGFSFAVYGDSRTMMFLPYRAAEKAVATNYMVDVFKLAFPEKVAQEVVAKEVKLIYDPQVVS
jgi:hypothetical protein